MHTNQNSETTYHQQICQNREKVLKVDFRKELETEFEFTHMLADKGGTKNRAVLRNFMTYEDTHSWTR